MLEELGVETWEQFVALDHDEIEAMGGSAFAALDLFTDFSDHPRGDSPAGRPNDD